MALGKTMMPPPVARTRQVADFIREKIVTGDWPVGSRIPSTRELACQFDVSLNTVHGALRELEVQNYLNCRARVGGFVKSRYPHRDAPSPDALKQVAFLRVLSDAAALSPGDTWIHRIIESAEAVLDDANVGLTLQSYAKDDSTAVSNSLNKLQQLSDVKVAGMICLADPSIEPLLPELDARDIPWVTINRVDDRSTDNFVTAYNFDGGRRVGRCFARLGLDQVLILSGPRCKQSMLEKVHGFIQGFLDEGVPISGIDYRDEGTQEVDGYRVFTARTHEAGPPKAVFATGDGLALGALRACRDLGLGVPENVAVVSGTGLQLAEYAHPSLSVISQPMEEIGRQAATMLLQMIDEGVRRVAGRYIPCEFILRESFQVPDEIRAESIN